MRQFCAHQNASLALFEGEFTFKSKVFANQTFRPQARNLDLKDLGVLGLWVWVWVQLE
ncbi:MAG: hypothetical protein AB7N80_15370 [Bdellovibrionales bacterium]